jgi:hypothetical protein
MARKKKLVKDLQNIFMEARNVGDDRDARVVTFLHRLLASELPPQSCVQESAAWVIASRFIAYPETGAMVLERTTMGDQAVYSSNTERLACVLVRLRVACAADSGKHEEEAAAVFKQALNLAERLQHPVVAPFTSHAFGLFNGLICAVAKSFVSFVVCPEGLASHGAKLIQVVPEDVERVAGNVLASRCREGVWGTVVEHSGAAMKFRRRTDPAAESRKSPLNTHADRIAAGIEWMSLSIAGRIFRLAFTASYDDSPAVASALTACREFVATRSALFSDIDGTLESLLHAFDKPHLDFIRATARAQMKIAGFTQMAESCDLEVALALAGYCRDHSDNRTHGW